MKKLFLALLALPLIGMMTACSSDDDMPQVNIDLNYGNSTVVDNQVYVVKPDTFKIESVTVTAAREGKKATNGPVSYFINGVPLGTNPVAPYGIELPTDDMEVGSYAIQLYMPIYEQGCELASSVSEIRLNVVADSADIPTAAVPTVMQRVAHTYK